MRVRLASRTRVRLLGMRAGGLLAGGALGALLLARWESLRPLAPSAALLTCVVGPLLRLELDLTGRLRLSRRPPRMRRLCGRARRVCVRPTGDERGRGAFAACRIPRGALLGFYEGDLLDAAAFHARYAGRGRRPEHAIAVDGEFVVDGAERAKGGRFTPAHMNHAKGRRANVGRLHQWRRRRVMMFAKRDVLEGEELCFDYGRAFWKGREEDLL